MHTLQPSSIPAMEEQMRLRGVSVPELCDAAGINRSTWWRWKTQRLLPRMEAWNRACAAYSAIMAANPAPRPMN